METFLYLHYTIINLFNMSANSELNDSEKKKETSYTNTNSFKYLPLNDSYDIQTRSYILLANITYISVELLLNDIQLSD